ncbi:hypothetical protein [Streptomyces chartreusis]|uniref:hypothetical protein n=1 Tax=Streptomyces chartreusis TaxID=1969 RepID=UPI003659E2F0
MKFLRTWAKGSARALAERLGVSPRTVERYRVGQLTNPQKRLRATLLEETGSARNPQARAQVCERASVSGGMMVKMTACFGFTCSGSSDGGGIRVATTPISPTYALQILDLQEARATEEDLFPVARRP